MNVLNMPAPYVCANCSAKYHFFRLYCKTCGCVLPAALTGQGEVTQLLSDNQAQKVDVQWGRTYFHRYARLVFVDESSDEIMPVALDTPQVIIGRTSAGPVGSLPGSIWDTARTPPALPGPTRSVGVAFRGMYAAANGISRTHARLDLLGTTLCVTDLDSKNGTFLDGLRLTPQVPYVLHNRASLQLGKLLLRVQFR